MVVIAAPQTQMVLKPSFNIAIWSSEGTIDIYYTHSFIASHTPHSPDTNSSSKSHIISCKFCVNNKSPCSDAETEVRPAGGAQPPQEDAHGLVLGDPGHGGPQPEQEQPREVGVGVREQPGRHDEVRLQLQHEEAGQAEELRGGREAGEECGR